MSGYVAPDVRAERTMLATVEALWSRAGYPRSTLDGAAGFSPGWHARKVHRRPALRVEVVGYADEDVADEVTTALATLAHRAGWHVTVLHATLLEVAPRHARPDEVTPG